MEEIVRLGHSPEPHNLFHSTTEAFHAGRPYAQILQQRLVLWQMARVATSNRMVLRSGPSGIISSFCNLMMRGAALSTANGIWSGLRMRGRRATIKAHPATPHYPRPYGEGISLQGWRATCIRGLTGKSRPPLPEGVTA